MKLETLGIVLLFLIAPYCKSQCDSNIKQGEARLTVTPFGAPGPHTVKEFVNLKSRKNLAQLFGAVSPKRNPYVAEHVPFGTYRITMQSHDRSVTWGRLIDVCEKDMYVEVRNHFAKVHVMLLNATEDSVKDGDSNSVHVMSFQNDDGTAMTSLFKGAVADQVPYGSYDLKLFDPIGGVTERHVDVFQPDVWVYSGILALDGDTVYSGPRNVVQGKIENIPDNEKPLFVTMVGLYVPYMINSPVLNSNTGDGTFSFVGVNPNSVFMLLTIGQSGVLDAREFKIPDTSEIVVDLSHPSAPKSVAQ